MRSDDTIAKQLTLSLEHVFHAPRRKVFAAWTDPHLLKQWFGPQGVITERAVIDLRVGGAFQITMREPGGEMHSIGGVFREITPPRKLVYTWNLHPDGCSGSDGYIAETVVTVEFIEEEESTTLRLTHEFLPSEKSVEEHSFGWKGSFQCLQESLGESFSEAKY